MLFCFFNWYMVFLTTLFGMLLFTLWFLFHSYRVHFVLFYFLFVNFRFFLFCFFMSIKLYTVFIVMVFFVFQHKENI